jgi:hypothetical protein
LTVSKFIHNHSRNIFHMMSEELRWNIIKFRLGIWYKETGWQ